MEQFPVFKKLVNAAGEERNESVAEENLFAPNCAHQASKAAKQEPFMLSNLAPNQKNVGKVSRLLEYAVTAYASETNPKHAFLIAGAN